MKEKFLKFIENPKYIYWVYIIVAAFSAIAKYRTGEEKYNNYRIFKGVFINTLAQKNLYLPNPEQYLDVNHYGILFSAIIAPFAVMPDWLGLILWNIFNTLVFIYAIKKLPFSDKNKAFFAWLCLQEYITAAVSLQFNIALTGLIILSATSIYQRKETTSAFAILVGTFVKLYGIVGLTQFFFIKNKSKFILSLVLISLLFLIIPMFYSGVHFGLQSYADWYTELVHKNAGNASLSSYQDISVMGFFRRIFQNPEISNLYFYALGLPLFALPYLRINQYKNSAFQMMILASTLIFTVLFSSSSESPTYILAVSGVMIWFLMQKEKSHLIISLLIFVLIFTSFSHSDLFPRRIKDDYIIKYSLKSLPCTIVWLRITYELLTKNFEKEYQIS